MTCISNQIESYKKSKYPLKVNGFPHGKKNHKKSCFRWTEATLARINKYPRDLQFLHEFKEDKFPRCGIKT